MTEVLLRAPLGAGALPVPAETLSSLAAYLVERAAGRSGEFAVNLLVVDDAEMQELNREHRGVDHTTDVLSFPQLDPSGDSGFALPPGLPLELGDVVISEARAAEQAAEYGHGVAREFAYLFCHGVLHLLGYDHEKKPEQERMRRWEEEALRDRGLGRDELDA